MLYLEGGAAGLGELPLVQLLPALDELLDDGVLWADDLEARDVGSSRDHAVQTHVGHTLQRTDHSNDILVHTGVLHTLLDTPCRVQTMMIQAGVLHNVVLDTVVPHNTLDKPCRYISYRLCI